MNGGVRHPQGLVLDAAALTSQVWFVVLTAVLVGVQPLAGEGLGTTVSCRVDMIVP